MPSSFNELGYTVVAKLAQALPVTTAALEREFYIMLKWAIIFAVLALVSGLLGFSGLAGAFATVAKILFVLFVILLVIFLIMGFMAGKKIKDVID